MTNPRLSELEENFKKNGGSYKKIPIKEIFSIKKGVRLTKQKMISGNIPFVGASSKDNGITNFISNNEKIQAANTITVTYNGSVGQAFYQPMPFWASDDVNVLYPLFNLTKNAALYFITILKRQGTSYGYSYKWNLERMQDDSIEIPITKDGEPDTDFMADYVRELEADYVRELEAYLKAAGLNDYELTKEEENLLKGYDQYAEILLNKLFHISSSKKKFNANSVKFGGSLPYVARGSAANGIRGYIDESELFLNAGKTISFGQDTATAYYQEKPYFTGDKIKIFTLKDDFLSENLGLYFVTAIRKTFSNYSWGTNSFSEEVINQEKVNIPVLPNGNVNTEFMERFITAIKKLVIADVVKFKDEYLYQTKKVVNEA